MKRFFGILIFSLFLHLCLTAQETLVVLSQDQFDRQQRIQLSELEGWKFHSGRNSTYGQLNIDMTDWKTLKPTELTTSLEDENGRLEGWFRIRIKLNNDMSDLQLSIDRNLWAATDIYLDGKLVFSFGETGEHHSDFQYYNPNHKLPLPLDLKPDTEYLLAMHFVNYQGILTPGKVKYNKENLADLLNLTGQRHIVLEEHYRRSSYIHSTLWVAVSFMFMVLFWLMSIQNPKEKVFTIITYLSLVIFLVAVSKSMVNFFELSFAQEKARYILYGGIGPLINVAVFIIAEWIVKNKTSAFSKFCLIAFPITSVIAHLFNVSVPFGILNTILTAYFFYLIIANYRKVNKSEWSVLMAMAFYNIVVNIYLIIRKVSMEDYLLYGNLLFSILLLVPLVALLIFVSLRFKEIIQERMNAQEDKNLQLEAINAASAKFVPSTFLNFLGKKNILDATLGDYVEKQVTVLFSDIRDYTRLSEKMTPEENFRFVNAFNRRMGPIIQNHKGFINQYLGDGIMAIFPENVNDTLQAAIDMQKELSDYNKDRILKGKIPIRMGIGLHSGPLIMGIIGDDQRMDAATISDTVNATSRIEGLTKYFGVNILLSGESLDKLHNEEKYNLRYLGIVQVKGKEEAVKIYECFDGDSEVVIRLKKENLTEFNRGLKLYFSKDFKESQIIFEKIADTNPEDIPAKLFLEKSKIYKQNGIDAEWNGMEKMLVK